MNQLQTKEQLKNKFDEAFSKLISSKKIQQFLSKRKSVQNNFIRSSSSKRRIIKEGKINRNVKQKGFYVIRNATQVYPVKINKKVR